MFSRAAFSSFRNVAAHAPVKQNVRRYATPAEPKKQGVNPFFYLVAAGVAGGAAYYYYSAGAAAPVVELKPAIPTLTGDGQWVDLKLVEVEQVTPNTKRFRFALPTEDHVSGLKTASAILTKFKGPNDAKPNIRPYTPTSDESARGYIDLLVKKYEKGPMSTHMHNMSVDQTLAFKGPLPKYEWTPNKHDHIALIAGGTGITPMHQLARAIFNNPEDTTKVTLVFGNLTEEDILLKKEWDHLENTYPQRFKAFYVLDNAPKNAGWATQGRVTKELLKTVLPEPGSGNNKIFVCGPPGMYKAISGTKKSPSDQGELDGVLKELGYSKEDVYKF
ncbi:NADH-cytochrome b5 reductase [Rhizina undulata]